MQRKDPKGTGEVTQGGEGEWGDAEKTEKGYIPFPVLTCCLPSPGFYSPAGKPVPIIPRHTSSVSTAAVPEAPASSTSFKMPHPNNLSQ